MPRGKPGRPRVPRALNGSAHPAQSIESAYYKGWPTKKRSAEDAKHENPDTQVHESEDIAKAAEREGRKESLELLERIRQAGSDRRALAAIRREL